MKSGLVLLVGLLVRRKGILRVMKYDEEVLLVLSTWTELY
jgi:hypothetical protein